jgi:hypothetical protein
LDLAALIAQHLAALAREGFGGRFHAPPGEPLSAVASAHAALVLLHLDPTAAREELRTLYRACQTPSGLVLRERSEAATPAAQGPIAPPVAAYAAARLAASEPDAARARELLDPALRELDAIWAERLPPDTSLPVILHPLESMLPSSPAFDALVESTERGEWEDELSNLQRSAAACAYHPERALRAGHAFVVEDPTFCGWFLIALEEICALCERLGVTDAVRKLKIRSDMIAETLAERLWWNDQEIYAARNRKREELLAVVSAGGLVPTASRKLLQESESKRALDRHLRPSATQLWGARAISLNPILRDRASDPDEVPGRGNAASPLAHFWAHLALVRAGRDSDARVARTQLEELVSAHGFRAFYDPDTGLPLPDAPDSPKGALVLEMQAQETR